MGSLATHLTASLFFVPLGIRRLLCSSSLYLKNPSQFRSRLWYFSNPRWKNLDFYVLTVALPIASFADVFLFLTFSGHPTYRFAFFQRSLVLFIFWLLALMIAFRGNFDHLPIHDGFVFILTAMSFLAEYSVIGKGINGLGEVVYGWLGGLTLVCAASCLYLSIRPTAFFAEFLLSSGIVFKGTWLFQTGLSLYSDAFSLRGCHKILTGVECDLEDDNLRGLALMKLLFIGHAIGVLITCLVLFAALSSDQSLRHAEGTGSLLSEHELLQELEVE